MRLNGEKVLALCRERDVRLTELLKSAGVSKTAYYSLSKKESVLPKSVVRLAQRLHVSPAQFLDDPEIRIKRIHELREETDRICRNDPECDRDVVFRTLSNLDLSPSERLRKALHRAKRTRIRPS